MDSVEELNSLLLHVTHHVSLTKKVNFFFQELANETRNGSKSREELRKVENEEVIGDFVYKLIRLPIKRGNVLVELDKGDKKGQVGLKVIRNNTLYLDRQDFVVL